MGKFVVRKTNTGVKFDLKAGNGQVIATSEVYTTAAAGAFFLTLSIPFLQAVSVV